VGRDVAIIWYKDTVNAIKQHCE